MTVKNQNLAGIGARVLGAILDFIFVMAIAYVVMIVFFWLFPTVGYSYEAIDAVNKGRGALIGLLVDALYTIILQSGTKQATWGQRIVGVKLQRADGGEVGVGVAIGRWLMSCLSSILLKIGYLIAIFTKKKQTLHDLVAGTVVLNVDKKYSQANKEVGTDNFDEEEFWREASLELSSGNRKEGLWAKCFAEADGDENRAKAIYLKERVEQFKISTPKLNQVGKSTNPSFINVSSPELIDVKLLKQKRLNIAFFSILGIIVFGVILTALFGASDDVAKHKILSSNTAAQVSKTDDLKISFNEPFYTAKVCSLNTFIDFNRCEKTEIRKARFLIYQNEVRIEYTYSDSVVRTETLKDCVIKDEKNWNCGGVAQTDVYDAGRRSLIVSGLYQMINGVISTESATYTSYVDGNMKPTKYRPLPIFILN